MSQGTDDESGRWYKDQRPHMSVCPWEVLSLMSHCCSSTKQLLEARVLITDAEDVLEDLHDHIKKTLRSEPGLWEEARAVVSSLITMNHIWKGQQPDEGSCEHRTDYYPLTEEQAKEHPELVEALEVLQTAFQDVPNSYADMSAGDVDLLGMRPIFEARGEAVREVVER